jgi:hypothetical protein
MREFRRLNRAVEAARLQVPIDSAYRLADAARAHERLAKGHVLGRLSFESVRSRTTAPFRDDYRNYCQAIAAATREIVTQDLSLR